MLLDPYARQITFFSISLIITTTTAEAGHLTELGTFREARGLQGSAPQSLHWLPNLTLERQADVSGRIGEQGFNLSHSEIC